ncbi:Predicted arabinose efflux permease, MFS family [Nocardioides sp. YR527]|uniref:MFS transporter n=1 Tax=Nocardioides sp. YR527 TaxID=1881028 RepID=UPI00088708BB|nr:MFS transporter [Nocardioides sp. YR527]SDK65003.1 Predicted arabinose efflux permease, MFS family [Nocardioides sp. YR527]
MEQRVDGRPLLAVLITLCVTVTAAYGVLYYAFTVLQPQIVDATGWSAAAITTAFSAGTLVGAVAGIPVGRVIQRFGPRWVMAGASALGAASLLVVAAAPSYWIFALGWLLVGLSTAGTFYPPAFAALTHWFGTRRVDAITTLTLAGGFASTIFAPLTDALAGWVEWRWTYVILAVAFLVLTFVPSIVVLDLAWQPTAPSQDGRPVRDRDVLRSSRFVLLTIAGTLVSLAVFASIVHLVPFLVEHGLSATTAAWALGLSGAGQVAGRAFYPMLARRFGVRARMIGGVLWFAVSVALLPLLPAVGWVMIVVAVLTGTARGLYTLIAATVVGDVWGPERYAALNGVYSAPAGVAGALAPAVGAALATVLGGYDALYWVLAATVLVAALLAGAALASMPD